MQSPKLIQYGSQARKKLADGIDKLAEAVATTLGPGGNLVLSGRMWGSGRVTKDGVTVAKEVILEDPFEDEGAKLCIEVAAKSNALAGDGTTTATVLARALVNEGLRRLDQGVNVKKFLQGMNRAAETVLSGLKDSAESVSVTDIDSLRDVATISGNDREVGDFVSRAFAAAGEDGVVTYEPTTSGTTSIDRKEGLQFDKGMASPFFRNHPERVQWEVEDCLVLTAEVRINSVKDVAEFLEKVHQAGKPVLLIVDDIDPDPLAVIVHNVLRGVITACVVKAPAFGERKKDLLQDISVVTGGRFFGEETAPKLGTVKISELGTAKKVLVTQGSTTITQDAARSEAISEYVVALKKLYAEAESPSDRDKLKERIGKLSSGVAVIRIGAATESEMAEKKDRYEDAINATKAAIESGVVPGGGVALLTQHIRLLNGDPETDPDVAAGFNATLYALKAPFFTILENAGLNGHVGFERVLSRSEELGHLGIDASSGVYDLVDMRKAGIIDPLKVTTSALQSAVSIASMVLQTSCVIVPQPEPKKES